MSEVKVLSQEDLEKKASKELVKLDSLQGKITELELALSSNPQFIEFMKFKKALDQKSSEVFDNIEQQMIDNGIKRIKGDWGYMTIVETNRVKVVDESKLPRKFFRRQVDVKKLNDHVKLSGELPEGTESYTTKHLQKKIKLESDK